MPKEFEKAFEVRWSDVDFNGHLRNTSYSEFANHARVCLFQEGGFPVSRMIREGIGPVLLSEQIEYRREAFLGQFITVRCQLAGMSADGKHWRILHTLLHADGTTAATLTSAGAWMDTTRRKLVAPPPEARSMLETIRSAECQLIP